MSDPAAPQPPPAPSPASESTRYAPRWLVVLAWSIGPAGLYALLGLLHAGLVERILDLDIGFGRSLAFWVGAIYLALPLWGFLPARPSGRYARPGVVRAVGALGVLATLVCGGYTAAGLVRRWNPSVGVPVLASLLLLAMLIVITLRVAAHDEEREGPHPRPPPPRGEGA